MYDYNPEKKNPWSDPWIGHPWLNDFHAIRGHDNGSRWDYVDQHYPNKNDPRAKPEPTPDPSDPDSYWTKRKNPVPIPEHRYCCCKKKEDTK